MSNTKSGSAKDDPANKRWAFSATISENHAQNGIELHFDNEPHPELQSKLRVKSFLPNKSQVMWYAKKSPATEEFAKQVKHSLPAFQSGPHLLISPSYEPIKANIESKRYSFVMISLKGGEETSYVVFEPSKPRAEVIAANFAHNKFSGDLAAIAVSPKMKIKEARMLFEEGRIIHEVQMENAPQYKPAVLHAQPGESTPKSEAAETLSITIGGEKANVSLILHEFHNWLKDHPEHKGSTKIERPVYAQWLHKHHPEVNQREESIIWDRHQRLTKILHRIGKLDAKQIVVEPYSSIYKKLLRLIPGLMEQLQAGEDCSGKSHREGYMDLHFDFLHKDKQGYVIALAHYYEMNGDLVPDPDMQIRIIPEMNMAEAMTFQNLYRYDEVYVEDNGKEMVNTKMKTQLNTHLNEWLSTLISYKHSVKLVKESESQYDKSEEGEKDNSSTTEESPSEHDIQPIDLNLVEIIPETEIGPESLYDYASTVAISEQDYDAIERLLKQADTTAFYYDEVPYALNYSKSQYVMHEVIAIPPKSSHPNFNTKPKKMSISPFDEDKTKDDSSRGERKIDSVTHVHIGNIQPIPNIKIDVTKLPQSTTVKISYPAYDAIGFALKHANTRAFSYEGKVWVTTANKQGEPIMQELPELTLQYQTGQAGALPAAIALLDELKHEPLADDEGRYTPATAGKAFETLTIPMPKDCYDLSVNIVSTSFGDFRSGVDISKKVGNRYGENSGIKVTDIPYATHEEALHEALIYSAIAISKNDEAVGTSIHPNCSMRALNALLEYAAKNGLKPSELTFKGITSLYPIDFIEVVPLPLFRFDGKDRPDVFRISQGTFNRLERMLELKGDELFYFQNKVWVLVRKPLGIMHVPELDKKAKTYFKKEYQKSEQYIHLQKLLEVKNDPARLAFKKLNKLIPGLSTHLRTATSGQVKFKGRFEERDISCFFYKDRSELFIVEFVDEKKELESSVNIYPEEERAEVTAEWLSDWYADRYDRLDEDGELEGDDMAIGEDMTRGFSEWLDDILDEGITITTITPNSEAEHPLEFLNEPALTEGSTGTLEFNPYAVAALITKDNELYEEWNMAYPSETIPARQELTKDEVRRIKDFYNTFILDHSNQEEAYRELLNSLGNKSFTVSEKLPTPEPAPNFKRVYEPEAEKEISKLFQDFKLSAPFSVKEGFDRNLPVIDFATRNEEVARFFRKKVEDPVYEKTLALNRELSNLGRQKGTAPTKKEIMQKLSELEQKLAKALQTMESETLIFQDDVFAEILRRAAEKGHAPQTRSDLTSFRDYVDSAVFDTRVMENFHTQPICSLAYDLIDEFFDAVNATRHNPSTRFQSATALAKDLVIHSKTLPNVLVPANTSEPFWTGDLNKYDKKGMAKSFPHLVKISAKSLSKVPAIEMFELSQMSHPTDWGLKVDRFSLLEEWGSRGKRMFMELGWPTDPDYPYVNLHTGYSSLDPLGVVIENSKNQPLNWWAAIENWRPMADLNRGLEILDSEIALLTADKASLINPKTKKPKSDKKEAANHLSYEIKSMIEGKQIIQNYLDKNKAVKKRKPQMANISGLSNTKKIAIKEILLTPNAVSRQPDFTTGTIVNTWSAADAYVLENLGKRSDIYYKIVWKDKHTTEGMIDLEPSEFFNGIDNIFQNHVVTILTNISKADLSQDGVLSQKDVDEAAAELKTYLFADIPQNSSKETEKTSVNLTRADTTATSSAHPSAPLELKTAIWEPQDDQYPVDKAEIDGVVYHQARLREALLALIAALPMERRLGLAEEMSGRFKERRSMQEYFNDNVNGTGKFGKKKFAGAYYDDLILDNDVMKPDSGWKVSKYLIATLTKKDALVDQPIKEKPKLRKIAKTDQHQLNKQIEALIDEKDKQGASFTAEEKDLLRQYAGSGGLMKQGAKGRGVLYEYYTPDWLVEQMWSLAYKFGYTGGSVLEPAVGTGNFLKYAPKDAVVFGFETNHYSARIAQVLYPNAHIHEKAFENLFFAGNIHLKDKIDHVLSSLVIGNPPYGEFTGKYAGMGEKKWTGALEYDQYFMLRGLDLLQPGGLMVFLVPSLFIQSGQKYNKIKDKILKKAEVMVCYRLPQNVFATTDIGTDIIVLRKRGGTIASENHSEGIDEESLPTTAAQKSMKCSITGLSIDRGDRIFYDAEKQLYIKALKIKGGDNQAEIMQKNPWLSKIIKQLFENYMTRHGDRNELREKYYSTDAIYDPTLVVDAGLEYIHEAMLDDKVSSCWLHKIDITEAFSD